MSVTVLARDLTGEASNALDAVAPATIVVAAEDPCIDRVAIRDFVNSVLDKVISSSIKEDYGQGHTALFTTEVYAGELLSMDVLVFGDYLSVTEDFYALAEELGEGHYCVDVFYGNDLLRMESIDQQYYDLEDVEFMDWITYKPASSRAIKEAVEMCAAWAEDGSISLLGEEPFTKTIAKAVCLKNRWKFSDFKDPAKWRLDDPRGPALWLLRNLAQHAAYIKRTGEDKDGTLRIGVKFECSTEDYARAPLLKFIAQLDEAARTGYKTLSV